MKTILYIVNNYYKEKILKQNKILSNNKYMTLEEFKKSYLFDYDDETIYYVMKTRNIKYSIAKNYIDNLYLIWNTTDIDNQKVIELKDLYYELKENHLIKKNYIFKEYLKNVDIIVTGYILNKFEEKIFNDVKKITKVEIQTIERKNYIPKVYRFDNIEEEVVFIANKVIEDIKNNDIEKIKIVYFKEYEYLLKIIFNMFNIPINIKSSSILYGNNICKEWIMTLIRTKDINETINILIEKYGYITSIKKLIDITNTLPEEEFSYMYLDYFISKCKITNMENSVKEGIECFSNLDSNIDEENIIYLLGCNGENIPRTYKDEEYLSDEIRNLFDIDTSYDNNYLEKEKCKISINNKKNLTITYKSKTPFETYTKSSLIENLDIEKEEYNKYKYSNLYNKISLSRKIDKLIKYGVMDKDISKLFGTYKNIQYKKYNNKFTGIPSDTISMFLNDKVHLSYSSINNYYLCSFKYYINNLLKLDIYEENFMAEIGNLYHYILSKSIEHNFDFECEYSNYVKEKEWSNKEKFFLNKLKDELMFVIETLKYHNRFTTLKQALCEEKMYTNPSQKIIFNGIIDKIMYKEDNNQKIVSIVDYKTGNPETNIMNIPYGLEMQLPIYVYLLKNNAKFKESKIVGFYLQKILNKDFSYDGKDYLNEKRRLLRLDGYSINDELLLEQFDSTYKDSEMIRGMKIGKNGFYSYAKVITEDEINNMSNKVEEKILEAGNNILNGKFEINPKRINDELIGCKYCKFKDICYKTEKDIINLEKITTLDFLGGE